MRGNVLWCRLWVVCWLLRVSESSFGSFNVGIGQDLHNVELYMATMAGAPKPSFVMSYTSLSGLRGLWEPVEYGSGVEFASKSLAAVEGASLQLGLYLDDVEAAASGRCEGNLTMLREYLESLAPRQALVRIGYEFDNPSNRYAPATYVRAFRVAAAALRRSPESNVKTVWHSWSFDVWEAGNSIEDWWPGKDFVDWCGVSIFQQGYLGDSHYGHDFKRAEDMARFCATQNLPVMIAESTPFGLGDTESPDTIWERWFENVRRFVKTNKVQLWCYINCDWDEQPMWRGQGWGNTRIQDYPELRDRWIQMLRREHTDRPPLTRTRGPNSAERKVAALLAVPFLIGGLLLFVLFSSRNGDGPAGE